MATTSLTNILLNHHAPFEDQEEMNTMHTQTGFFTLPPLSTTPPQFGDSSHSSTKEHIIPPLLLGDHHHHETLLSSLYINQREDFTTTISDDFGGPRLFSFQRSRVNNRTWGDIRDEYMRHKISGEADNHYQHYHHNGHGQSHIRDSPMKMKKINKGRRKVREPRFCFKTMSDVDVLDDGYKWRKYGQKVVKNTQHPRSYYRCTEDNCRVKKRVERLTEDPRMVITTYEGRHAHSPSHDLEDLQAQSELNNFLF